MVRKPLWLSRLWIIPVAMVINSVSLASPFLSVKFVAALRGRPHQKNQTKTGSIIVGNYPDKSWSSNQKKKTYCGWKKSCTTLDGWNPINDGINHLSTGAGFLPPTVCMYVMYILLHNITCIMYINMILYDIHNITI